MRPTRTAGRVPARYGHATNRYVCLYTGFRCTTYLTEPAMTGTVSPGTQSRAGLRYDGFPFLSSRKLAD